MQREGATFEGCGISLRIKDATNLTFGGSKRGEGLFAWEGVPCFRKSRLRNWGMMRMWNG